MDVCQDWQYVSVQEDGFRGEICKISLQISINRGTLGIDFDNTEH